MTYYDAKDNARKSYDLAIATMRLNLERAKIVAALKRRNGQC